jgi:hypothetical protein
MGAFFMVCWGEDSEQSGQKIVQTQARKESLEEGIFLYADRVDRALPWVQG